MAKEPSTERLACGGSAAPRSSEITSLSTLSRGRVRVRVRVRVRMRVRVRVE